MFQHVSTLPRHAFSARDAARAADVWRHFQDLAVEASTASGWPPVRYRQEGTAFVVRSMLVQHHLEALYGEPLEGATWVSRMRRGMLCTREVRVRSARGPVATGRQEWVHCSASMAPARGPASLLEAFPVHAGPPEDEGPSLPVVAVAAPPHPPHRFTFRAWWTWMDPLDHANHPAYVDFCDEALSVAMRAAGLSPLALVPVAEEVTYRSGVVADDEVCVETLALGTTEAGAAVFGHRILVGERLCATATTVRRCLGEHRAAPLLDAVQRGSERAR